MKGGFDMGVAEGRVFHFQRRFLMLNVAILDLRSYVVV
jgi:hypothetical protein